MDIKASIDNIQIAKDLSNRYWLIILTSFFAILRCGTFVFIATLLFKEEFFMLKIAFLAGFSIYAFIKIYATVGAVLSIKRKKFTVELDTVTDVKHGEPTFVLLPDFVYARILKRYMEHLTFENSGNVLAEENEVGYASCGDMYYIVKIKVLGKEQIISLYSEKAYTYVSLLP